MAARLSPPALLNEEYDLSLFDCGVASLNEWLNKRAIKNQAAGASRTYVVSDDKKVVAYYCLSTGGIDRVAAPASLRRNMPQPIPVIVVGRLAVDRHYQNCGLGRALLRDAVTRSLQVAEVAGVAAILVHSLSEESKRFYLSSGFMESPMDTMTLCLMLRTVDKMGAS